MAKHLIRLAKAALFISLLAEALGFSGLGRTGAAGLFAANAKPTGHESAGREDGEHLAANGYMLKTRLRFPIFLQTGGWSSDRDHAVRP